MSRSRSAAAVLVAALCVGVDDARADRRTIADLGPKTLRAVRVSHPPQLDGHLDDEAWRAATPDDRFVEEFPDETRPPSERTTMWVVYDDRALYIALRCDDTHPEGIVAQLTRRDRDTDSDKISVDIDSRDTRTGAYHFGVNVSGVLTDGVRFNDTDYNPDWDGVWDAVTSRDAGGWSVEIEIPWRTLRFSGESPRMGFQVRRYLQRRQEVIQWRYVPRTESAEVSRYGQLVGLADLGPARLVQVWPYASMRANIRSGSGAENGTELAPGVGADVKIGLTSGLTLDATINPDFGQVEADQAQLNLTTFELFFPEKRPFFLEGIDLFATPIQQFYTRRVGRPPPQPSLADGEELVFLEPVGRIWGAAKVSGQLAPHLTIAALDAVTARQDATVRRADGTLEGGRLVDPMANYAVLRLRGDLGASYLGLMATAVDRFEDAGLAARPPALCPDGEAPSPLGASGLPTAHLGVPALAPGTTTIAPPVAAPALGRCTHDAYTGGLDGRLRTADGTWGVTAHAVGSLVEHGPTRMRPDGWTLRAGDGGWGLHVDGGKQGGDHVLFNVLYEGFSPTLMLDDAGYLRRTNLHRAEGEIALRSTNPIGPTLESRLSLFTYNAFSWEGLPVNNGGGGWLWLRLANFFIVEGGVGYSFDYDDNRELRDGAIVRRYGGWWWGFHLKTDPRRRIVAEAWLDANTTAYGTSWSPSATVVVRPRPNLELEFTPRYSFTDGDPRWYDTDAMGDGSRRYRMGDLESQSVSVTFRGIYTFTPHLSLQAYAQLFLASGHFSHFRVAGATGVRPYLPFSTFVAERCPYATSAGAACDPSESPDFRDGTLNLNVVLRWEYRPGSTLLAVYTRSQNQTDYAPAEGPGRVTLAPFAAGPAIDVLMLKVSFLLS